MSERVKIPQVPRKAPASTPVAIQAERRLSWPSAPACSPRRAASTSKPTVAIRYSNFEKWPMAPSKEKNRATGGTMAARAASLPSSKYLPPTSKSLRLARYSTSFSAVWRAANWSNRRLNSAGLAYASCTTAPLGKRKPLLASLPSPPSGPSRSTAWMPGRATKAAKDKPGGMRSPLICKPLLAASDA
ncbi:hypothetical protein D3C72_1361420 [compost metagenome]